MAETQKFLDNLVGLPTLWAQIKQNFVAKEAGKGLSSEDFTAALKTKLEGIAEGAEVNQDAFSHVTVGETTIDASSKTDTVTVAGAGGITVSADAATKKVTITAPEPAVIDTALSDTSTNAVQNKVVKTAIDGKQDTLTAGQLAAVNSGITADKVAQYDKAQANVIETVKVNGIALVPDTAKAVDVTVPTDNKDLANGAGYQTAADVQTAINTAIASAYIYKGSVDTAAALPASGQKTGDVYNIVAASDYGPAGMNVAWNGTAWDALGSSISIEAMTADDITAICTMD